MMTDSRSSVGRGKLPLSASSIRWSVPWLLVLSTLSLASASLPGGPKEVEPFDPNDDSSLITLYPAYTVLFPWFTQMLGVLLFFLLCKFECPVPFAAIMFLVGAACGVGSTLRYENQGTDGLDQLSISVLQWSNIDSGVLLLVFLPGLIFRDAIEVNFHMFYKSLSQLLLLAFPLVLVGAALTAGIGKYVLINTKYGTWPISLWMVLGSILASTDPIAVGSVLRKLGAPPRLQMHICGESLINDGSALVFFVIFTQQYLADLHLEEGISLSEGVALFCRLALGGTVVGIAFAIGLCAMLHVMDTRLEPEYNIVQVVAALSTAYISYYVSERVCNMSGIIACVVCGITVRAVGKGLIREHHLMDSYLALMEHLFLDSIGSIYCHFTCWS
jgi:NhaP-type Na+/H+ and K+/H+ antiporter